MYDFIQLLHTTALFFALGAAPLFYLLTWMYRRSFKRVEYEWKKPQTVAVTIVSFIANLTLFILACFFFAGYYGSVKIDLVALSPEEMKLLSIDCMLFFAGVSAAYMGVQNLFIQYVCKEGVLVQKFEWRRLRVRKTYIYWNEIKDYFTRNDYPVTYYNFIVKQNNETFGRKTLRVPFYALNRFESLLELNLQKQRELRERSSSVLRNISRDLPSD